MDDIPGFEKNRIYQNFIYIREYKDVYKYVTAEGKMPEKTGRDVVM
jgi:hypothetical protein